MYRERDRNPASGSARSPTEQTLNTQSHGQLEIIGSENLFIGGRGLYQSLLESNGIRCELLNEGISDILPIPGDLSKIRLVVNEADAAKAEEILAAGFDQEEFDTESAKRRKKP